MTGAFLGSFVGAACIVLVGQLGYTASFCGVIMAVCALRGCRRFAGVLSRKGILFSSCLILSMTYMANKLQYALLVSEAGEMGVFAAFRSLDALLEEGVLDTLVPEWLHPLFLGQMIGIFAALLLLTLAALLLFAPCFAWQWIFVRRIGKIWRVDLARLNAIKTYHFTQGIHMRKEILWEELSDEGKSRAKYAIERAIQSVAAERTAPDSALGRCVLCLENCSRNGRTLGPGMSPMNRQKSGQRRTLPQYGGNG